MMGPNGMKLWNGVMLYSHVLRFVYGVVVCMK